MSSRVAIKSGYYFEIFSKDEIPKTLVNTGIKVTLKDNVYDLYKATNLEDERKIDDMFGDQMGYDIDEHITD